MEPISGFATIVSLLATYAQLKKDKNAQNAQDFIQWLDAHHLEEVGQTIVQSHGLLTEIDSFLHQNQEQLIGKLNHIDDILALISTKIDGLAGMARILNPDSVLSEQAMHFLRCLVNSGAKEIFYMQGSSQIRLIAAAGAASISVEDSIIPIHEPRFVYDDLETLASLGFLSPRFDGMITYFQITRPAVKFIAFVDEQTG